MPVNGHDWHLPAGLLSLVELRYGTVTRVHTNPMLAYVAADAALQLATQLSQQLVEVGFGEQITRTAEQVAQQLELRDQAFVSGFAADFAAATLRAEVRIRRCWGDGGAQAERPSIIADACLCTLIVWDVALTR